MIKKINILLFIMIGFIMTPNIAVVCGSSCNKVKIIKTEAKVCCDSKKESQQNKTEKGCCDNGKHDKKDQSCGGKCKHPSCKCVAPVLNILLSSFSGLKPNNNFALYTDKKSFTFKESTTLSGFYFIWTPPNIG
jgi:hypothetical protein